MSLDIRIFDDKKCKRQSVEAQICLDIDAPMGHASLNLIGYGGDESEARNNLAEMIDQIRKQIALA